MYLPDFPVLRAELRSVKTADCSAGISELLEVDLVGDFTILQTNMIRRKYLK